MNCFLIQLNIIDSKKEDYFIKKQRFILNLISQSEKFKLLSQTLFHRLDDDILNAMMKNACAASDNNFVISLIRMMQAKQIEPLEETVAMVEEYQHQVFRNLRNQRVHSKQTRNECFKLTRECKQFLRHFRLDKRSGNRGAKLIETPVDKQTENKGSKINEAPVNHKSKDKRKSIQSSA